MAIHSCGQGHLGCVNPAHLRWGSHVENMADRIAHGNGIGENHGLHKLENCDIMAIRKEFAEGALKKTLAAKFGVTRQAIRQIVTRETWRHLP